MTQRAQTLLTLAVIATILYVIGFKTGTVAVIVIAACVELWFWFKLITSHKQEKPPSNQ